MNKSVLKLSVLFAIIIIILLILGNFLIKNNFFKKDELSQARSDVAERFSEKLYDISNIENSIVISKNKEEDQKTSFYMNSPTTENYFDSFVINIGNNQIDDIVEENYVQKTIRELSTEDMVFLFKLKRPILIIQSDGPIKTSRTWWLNPFIIETFLANPKQEDKTIREKLLGSWKGLFEKNGTLSREWTINRKPNSTFDIKFTFYKNGKKTKEHDESGTWHYLNGLYFTKTNSVNRKKRDYFNSYKIIHLDNNEFVYESLQSGNEFKVIKVTNP